MGKPFRRFQKSTLNKTKGNYFIRMRTGWRKPRGIDNRARRKFRGTTIMPKIGYGSAKKTRHMLPCGLYKFTVSQSKDRKTIVERAEQLGLKVTNKISRMQTVERE